MIYENTRVLGASIVVWLKKRARSASCLAKANGLRTRGSRCPDESRGPDNHMERERGTFKDDFAVGSGFSAPDTVRVKLSRYLPWRKIRHLTNGAHELDELLRLHAFVQYKN